MCQVVCSERFCFLRLCPASVLSPHRTFFPLRMKHIALVCVCVCVWWCVCGGVGCGCVCVCVVVLCGGVWWVLLLCLCVCVCVLARLSVGLRVCIHTAFCICRL